MEKKYSNINPQIIKSKVEASASNLLKQDFLAISTNEKIVEDITYIYTKYFGWTYLVSFMDLYPNEIKGLGLLHNNDNRYRFKT